FLSDLRRDPSDRPVPPSRAALGQRVGDARLPGRAGDRDRRLAGLADPDPVRRPDRDDRVLEGQGGWPDRALSNADVPTSRPHRPGGLAVRVWHLGAASAALRRGIADPGGHRLPRLGLPGRRKAPLRLMDRLRRGWPYSNIELTWIGKTRPRLTGRSWAIPR